MPKHGVKSVNSLRDLRELIPAIAPQESRGPRNFKVRRGPVSSEPEYVIDINGNRHVRAYHHVDHTFTDKGGQVPAKPGSQLGGWPSWAPNKSKAERAYGWAKDFKYKP